jgi:hypothetical protein
MILDTCLLLSSQQKLFPLESFFSKWTPPSQSSLYNQSLSVVIFGSVVLCNMSLSTNGLLFPSLYSYSLFTHLCDARIRHAVFLGYLSLVHGICRLRILFVQQRELATDLCNWLQLLDGILIEVQKPHPKFRLVYCWLFAHHWWDFVNSLRKLFTFILFFS